MPKVGDRVWYLSHPATVVRVSPKRVTITVDGYPRPRPVKVSALRGDPASPGGAGHEPTGQ